MQVLVHACSLPCRPDKQVGCSHLSQCIWKADPAVHSFNALGSGVSGLETKNGGKTQSYALLVADTVVVKPGGAAPEILTNACTKGWSDVAYFFKVSFV